MTTQSFPLYKTKSTYYTAEKVMNARRNVDHCKWAKSIRDQAAARANQYLRLGHDRLWSMVTSQKLPRSYAVNQVQGCPICGKELFSYGRYAWDADQFDEPWKINCPNCHSKFPSNDFGRYYESGLDQHGLFQPELADRSLLVNTLYPEHGNDWGVDDGYGFMDEHGERWTFIAYYNHWKVWMHLLDVGEQTLPAAPLLGQGGMIECGLEAFQEAYILSGDHRYAQAGLILLDRVADVYPQMDSSLFLWEDGFKNSHGMRGTGKVVGCIWETYLVKTFTKAYDAFFPALNDPELIRFLSDKADKHFLSNRKQSVEDIMRNIEEGILLSTLQDIKQEKIKGNNGMHQSALALAAVVLDRSELSEQWLHLLFGLDGMNQLDDDYSKEDHLLVALVNALDRDGFGNEAAPHYNYLWVQMFRSIADITHGYERYTDADLYKQPFFIKMLKAHRYLMMCGKYTVSLGDSGKTGNPHVLGSLRESIDDFERTGDPYFARWAYELNGNSIEGLHGSLFSPDPEGMKEKIMAVLSEDEEFAQSSVHLSGFGLVALREGKGEPMRDLWIYYGRNDHHGHKDTLNIGLHAFGLDLSPDLGYPEFADNNRNRHHWTKHTAAHNTVLVDRSLQHSSSGGTPLHYVAASGVQFFEAAAPEVYPQTEQYMRSIAQIYIDEEHSYGFDVFRVKGGHEHHYLFHGAEGEVRVEGLSLVKQPSGTFAGPDVHYGVPSDAVPSDSPMDYRGSGFHYLDNVESDEYPKGPVISFDWSIRDTWGVLTEPADIHLRLSMLGNYDHAAIADGIPPQNKPGNPKKLKYAIVQRKQPDSERNVEESELFCSQFVSILEPYQNHRLISRIQALPVRMEDGGTLQGNESIAVRIDLVNGRTDYIYSSTNPLQRCIIDEWLLVEGAFAVYSIYGGEPIYAFLQAGTTLGDVIHYPNGSWYGEVLSFTRELVPRNEILIKVSGSVPIPDLFTIGSSILIYNSSNSPIMYNVYGFKQVDTECYLLDIGDVSPIRCWADMSDLSKGFLYDISKGNQCVLSRTSEWGQYS